jgi:hypothetical protein
MISFSFFFFSLLFSNFEITQREIYMRVSHHKSQASAREMQEEEFLPKNLFVFDAEFRLLASIEMTKKVD